MSAALLSGFRPQLFGQFVYRYMSRSRCGPVVERDCFPNPDLGLEGYTPAREREL
jgi:hypothetical protein